MNFIKKHPYLVVLEIFGILFVIGWIMSHEDPASSLMIFSAISFFITSVAGFVEWNENN